MSIDARLEQVLAREGVLSAPITEAVDEAGAQTSAEAEVGVGGVEGELVDHRDVVVPEEKLAEAVNKTVEELRETAAQREATLTALADLVPEVAEAVAARSMVRNRGDLSISAMREIVEAGRDTLVPDTQRLIGGWLAAPLDSTAPVTGTSQWFTVSHWHWLAATGHVRKMPNMLGLNLPYLFVSEAQIMHDLHAWGVFDSEGGITSEARTMFDAVSGSANITLFGTVLLYFLRHEMPQLPKQLVDLNAQCAVRNIPRVTFAIGITDREVVSVLLNNHTAYFDRRLRRSTETRDAAMAVRQLLDPADEWAAFPIRTPVTVTSDVADQLASDPDTRMLLDTEPDPDAPPEVRVADTEKRRVISKGVKRIAKAANISTSSTEVLSEIATATTHAMAQITLRTSDVDVSRGDPAAVAVNFMRDRGVVVGYPSGNGKWRRITYVPGDLDGIEKGIEALRNTYRDER